MGGKSNRKTLKPEIRKIRLGELKVFTESEFFRQLTHIPITPSRAESYLENPHGKPGDVVLLLAFAHLKLVGFRSLFAGEVQTEKGKIRFGWCSGNWVHPEFRRKGISKMLLEEAYADWDGKLMFTNYAPDSEKLYLKTGWFSPVHQFNGARAYLFPKTVKLLAVSRKNKFFHALFSWADLCIAGFSSLKVKFLRHLEETDIRFEITGNPETETFGFAEEFRNNFAFQLGEKTLNWIFKYPWISEKNREMADKYPFSSFSNAFGYQTIKIWQRNEWRGAFIVSVREGHLKTLFFWNVNGLEKEIATFLKWYCVNQKSEMLTVYHPGVAKFLLKHRFPFLRVKKYGQKIYSTFPIPGSENLRFQDGDGDVVFT